VFNSASPADAYGSGSANQSLKNSSDYRGSKSLIWTHWYWS